MAKATTTVDDRPEKPSGKQMFLMHLAGTADEDEDGAQEDEEATGGEGGKLEVDAGLFDEGDDDDDSDFELDSEDEDENSDDDSDYGCGGESEESDDGGKGKSGKGGGGERRWWKRRKERQKKLKKVHQQAICKILKNVDI